MRGGGAPELCAPARSSLARSLPAASPGGIPQNGPQGTSSWLGRPITGRSTPASRGLPVASRAPALGPTAGGLLPRARNLNEQTKAARLSFIMILRCRAWLGGLGIEPASGPREASRRGEAAAPNIRQSWETLGQVPAVQSAGRVAACFTHMQHGATTMLQASCRLGWAACRSAVGCRRWTGTDSLAR